jgi:GTPase SAR1 family protein
MRDALSTELDSLFARGQQECAAFPELISLTGALAHCQRTILAPMRVAFVGKTNCGKSTMLNAFLGEELAPTGNVELTFNVCWFRYGERQALRLHTVDGTIEPEAFESLPHLSTRCKAEPALLERIRYIEIFCPNPLLKTFDLIDTPGLHSFYQKDSRNTQALLTEPLTRPHALLFMFSGSLQIPDVEELKRFHQVCGTVMSGLTAIGALTKVDEWPRAFEDGRRSLDQLEKQHPHIRRLFYVLEPVVGPMGYGAQTLTTADLEGLEALVRLEPRHLARLTRDVNSFCTREYDTADGTPPSHERSRLYDRLGRYGIHAAVDLLRRGLSRESLGARLLEQSRVGRLRDIVTSHFGNRALLIKARAGLSTLRHQAFIASQRHRGPPGAAARRVAAHIDVIVANELRFREFSVLERFYSNHEAWATDSANELLAITGENGLDWRSRLGVSPDAPLDELLKLAEDKERRWRQRATETFADTAARASARVLADSYGEIYSKIKEAIRDASQATASLSYE